MRETANAKVLDRIIGMAEKITVGVLKFYAFLFLVAIVVIIYEIAARALGYSTVLSVEFSGYIMASMVTWASVYALFQKAHIRIDILYVKRSSAIKNLLDVPSIFLFFLAAVFLAWSALGLTLDSVAYRVVSNTTLRIPMWIPQASWALGFAWLAFCSALLAVKAAVSWVKNDRQSVAAAVGTGEEVHL